ELPLMDANLHVVADTAEARARANNVALSTALLLTLLAVAGGIALERRAALVRRVERERGLAAELDARVEERTRELTAANARMAQEVREREAAERELRQAQSELIQAARLATLGQMSAAISHEFNQPLAAIRSYSDNAEQLIAAGREQDAVGNLRRIAGLVDRMGAMSAHLKLFSRQADADVAPMPLTQAIDGAMLLLDGLVRRRGVRLLIERPERGPYVNAGAIRLEQVVVNLISNALDAVEGRPDPTVWVAVREVDGMAELSVADNGPGIDEANRERITAPFFTTKSEGRGLGLGLAIVYKIVRDFGGRLLVGDRDQGGALMRVWLPIAEPGAAGPASARPVQR
ncbi:MAG: GHKL domain-containing protein, partial [Burkholderiales bacterium]